MPRRPQFLTRTITAVVAVLLVGACDDPTTPTAPTEDPAPLRGVIACRADVVAGAISCQGPTIEPASGLSLSVIYGGQGTYVQLASDSVRYDGSDVFEAKVTVKNLITQPIGTPDGTTVTGIKVFFHSGPTVTSSTGPGTVDVSNEDGTGTFTASDQPYFEYNTILQQDDVSSAKWWQWSVPPTVGTFDFSVYVDTDIQMLDVWSFRYAHYTGSPNPVLPHDELVMMAVLIPELDGETISGDARRVEGWHTNCDIFGCSYYTHNSIAQTPLTGSIIGSQVELQFEAFPLYQLTFTGTYHPVRDSMGGDNWYAIRSTEPPPPTVEAPTGLSASIEAGPRVRLEWTDKSTDELGFRLYRGCMGAEPVRFDSISSDSERWWDWGLYDHYGQSCSYDIRAYIRDGVWGIVESAASNLDTVQIPVGAVTGIEPSEGEIGTTVIVTGLDFGTDPSVLGVVVADSVGAGPFMVPLSSTQIGIYMPNGGYEGRMPVTILKNSVVYGEAAWTQTDLADPDEPDNNGRLNAPYISAPGQWVGSFALGDWQDWRRIQDTPPPSSPRTLVFGLFWNEDKDLDLKIMDGGGSYEICGNQGVGPANPIIFQCPIADGFTAVSAVVVDEDAHSRGDTRLVSYRLIIQEPPP